MTAILSRGDELIVHWPNTVSFLDIYRHGENKAHILHIYMTDNWKYSFAF